ncbi:hypothetical protein BJV77DRAFT_616691 [Russula vinacea]|nr:hypothetical protein BJV77DRAFT_616691 [Russula vinacea]
MRSTPLEPLTPTRVPSRLMRTPSISTWTHTQDALTPTHTRTPSMPTTHHAQLPRYLLQPHYPLPRLKRETEGFVSYSFSQLSRWCTLSLFPTPLARSNHETKGYCSPMPSLSSMSTPAQCHQSLGSRACRHLRTQRTHTCPQQLTHTCAPDASRAHTLTPCAPSTCTSTRIRTPSMYPARAHTHT